VTRAGPTPAGVAQSNSPSEPPPSSVLQRAMAFVNRVALFIGMCGLVAAALVLTYSVFSRYFFHAATDWQDEIAVFCLTGAVFLCGAWVQAQRGHIGIEAIMEILPPRAERVRALVVDIIAMLFCAFFAWKSWTLLHEAVVGGMTTSSSFAPPLAIPYGLMATGMTLLAIQYALQVADQLATRRAQ
jgi:TRAP-type C4-dicarboxylate transport system permease small subunit